jgi:RNA polymerase sigma factor (sigma-70 family)
MLDVLRAQGKARRIELEMHKAVAPVLVVSEVGDMFAPPEVRAALVLFRPNLAESAEELYEQRESKLKLEAALATVTPTLDPHEWELTRRHYIEGVTLEVLAQEHGISVSTVSRRIDKTLKELGKKLKGLKKKVL